MSIKAIFTNKLKYIPDFYFNGAKIVGVKGGQAPFYTIVWQTATNRLTFQEAGQGMVYGNASMNAANTRIWGSFEYDNEVYVFICWDNPLESDDYSINRMAILKASDLIIQNGGVIKPLLIHMRQLFSNFIRKELA